MLAANQKKFLDVLYLVIKFEGILYDNTDKRCDDSIIDNMLANYCQFAQDDE